MPFVSSSGGNSTNIFTDSTSILIDAGTSLKNIKAATGRDSFEAIFITHDHSDHISSAGPAGRKFKCPMYMHPWVKIKLADKLDKCDVRDFMPGDTITIGDLSVKSFSTKHDKTCVVYKSGYMLETP